MSKYTSERRNFIRFFSQLKARYRLKDVTGEWQECTIININRKGLCIRLYASEKIIAGTPLLLETFTPQDMTPLTVEGKVKWFSMLMGGTALCGIELDEALEECTLAGVCSIYSGRYTLDE